MVNSAACPSTEELQRFLLGRIAGDEAAVLDEHLAVCAHCGHAMQALHGEDELVDAMRHAPTMPQDVAAASAAMMPWLKRLRSKDATVTVAPITLEADTPDTPSPAPSFDFLTPSSIPGDLGTLGNYRVLQVLGAGGMGMVFLAEDSKLHRLVALKVIKPELLARQELHERFLREARAIAALEHDNIVVIHQVDEHNGVPYLAMPLLKGESLEDRLQRAGEPLPIDEILRIGREIATGLAAAHAQNIVHRDIKPGNIFIADCGLRIADSSDCGLRIADCGLKGIEGSAALNPQSAIRNPQWKQSAIVKILDFGLAQNTVTDKGSGVLQGTPGYMSPEQGRGLAPDVRSDLFSLGCVLYRMATAAHAFKGTDTFGTLVQVATEEPPPPQQLNPQMPVALAELIQQLLAKEPAQRPASAQEVVARLAALEQARQPQPSRWPWLLGSAAVVLLAVGLTAWLRPWLEEPELPPPPEPALITFVYEEPDRHIVVQRGDDAAQVLDLRAKTEWLLMPGDYTLKTFTPVAGRRLEPAVFAVRPRQAVTLECRLVGEVAKQWHTLTVRAVALSPVRGAPWALSVGNDGKLGVWDITSAKEARFLDGHTAQLHCVAFSSDGKWAATGSGGKIGKVERCVRLWDVARLEELDIVLPHPAWVTAVAFAPRGDRLATGCNDGSVAVWNLATRARAHQLSGHDTQGVTAVAYTPDGAMLFTAGRDKQILRWDIAGEKIVCAYMGHTEGVAALALAPDGTALASVGLDGTLRRWHVDSGAGKVLATQKQALRCVAWSPDGKRLATGGDDSVVRLWDATTGAEVHAFTGHRGVVYGVAFAADGRRLLSGSADRSVRLWELPK